MKKKVVAAQPAQMLAIKRTAMQDSLMQKARKDGKSSGSHGEASASGAVAQSARIPDQLEVFEAAIKLFHARKFREARERFVAAMNGPDRGINHKSELHVRMCDRRLEEQALVLKTADEHYDYAITLINERKLPTARQHLLKGLEQQPDADHIFYALSLC